MFYQDDPWRETDSVDRVRQAVVTVSRTRVAVSTLRDRIEPLRRPLGDFLQDLERIEAAYAKDPQAYRLTRALPAVHLPSLLSVLEEIAELKASADAERYASLCGEIESCLPLAKEALAKIDDRRFDAAEITASVLADKLPAPAEGAQAGWRGWMSPLTGTAATAQSFITDRTARLQSSLSRRLSGGRMVATGYLADFMDNSLEAISAPVMTRLTAARSALIQAAGGGIAGGILVALVFPPAAPLVLGLAALETPDLYQDALRDASQRRSAQHAQRRAGRNEQITQGLSALRGISPIVRLETDHLHVTIDLDGGTADGIVLSGRNAGRMLSAIEPRELALMEKRAPDEDTAKILRSWSARTDKT